MSFNFSQPRNDECIVSGVISNSTIGGVRVRGVIAEIIAPHDDIGVPFFKARLKTKHDLPVGKCLAAQKHKKRAGRKLGWIFHTIFKQKQRRRRIEFPIARAIFHYDLPRVVLQREDLRNLEVSAWLQRPINQRRDND